MSSGQRAPRALVLAGGRGTRLAPLTDRIPKCLVEIDGRPLLDRWHTALRKAGVLECAVNVHMHVDQVARRVAHYNDLAPPNWSILEEPVLLGTAGTLFGALPWLEAAGDFIIVYADNVSDIDLGDLMQSHRDRRAAVTMALFRADRPGECGIAELDTRGRIVSFDEKPANPKSNLANAGIYAVSAGALNGVLNKDTKDIACDVLPALVGKMHGYVWAGYHRDVGNLPSLEQARGDLRSGKVR